MTVVSVLVLVFQIVQADKGDVDYIHPGASAKEILRKAKVDPKVLDAILKDIKPSIKTLSRPVWMFHRQASEYAEPVPAEGEVATNDPSHLNFFRKRMTDYFHNAEYSRSGVRGSGMYVAPSPGALEGYNDYMVGFSVIKGSRFIDYMTGEFYFTSETHNLLNENNCYAHSFRNLLENTGVCRAIGVAFGRAAKIRFLAYDYGTVMPSGCNNRPAFVMMDDRGVGEVMGWTFDRFTVARSQRHRQNKLRQFSAEIDDSKAQEGSQYHELDSFAQKYFFGCGGYKEDDPAVHNKRNIRLDLNYPKRPKKVASCEPEPNLALERFASTVDEIVRF